MSWKVWVFRWIYFKSTSFRYFLESPFLFFVHYTMKYAEVWMFNHLNEWLILVNFFLLCSFLLEIWMITRVDFHGFVYGIQSKFSTEWYENIRWKLDEIWQFSQKSIKILKRRPFYWILMNCKFTDMCGNLMCLKVSLIGKS